MFKKQQQVGWTDGRSVVFSLGYAPLAPRYGHAPLASRYGHAPLASRYGHAPPAHGYDYPSPASAYGYPPQAMSVPAYAPVTSGFPAPVPMPVRTAHSTA